jgi:hypothetical protein
MKMTKVKIVAISKDEGAYIPEWVFHHLYFGFAAIDIYVNRTTDNSIAILDKISKEHSNVNYYTSDWVDIVDEQVSMKMQHIVYASAYSSKYNQENYTHILFIDIDEFWVPLDFKSSINDFLDTLPGTHSSCSFPWFIMMGEQKRFETLPNEIYGHPSSLVKTISKTNLKIDKMRLHLPVFNSDVPPESIVLPDASKFSPGEADPQTISKEQIHNKFSSVVVHRMYRSQFEYMALLYRGNPEDTKQIKLNRPGWLGEGAGKDVECLSFNRDHKVKYDFEKQRFFKALNLTSDLEIAYGFVKGRYESVLKELPRALTTDFNKVVRVLDGVTDPLIKNYVDNARSAAKKDEKFKMLISSLTFLRNKPIANVVSLSGVFSELDVTSVEKALIDHKAALGNTIQSVDNFADALRNMALFFERKDQISLAYELMRGAYLFRPNGFTIRTKFYEYAGY